MWNPRFLVISLGNPLPKYDSLHSAGHFVVNGLVKALGAPPLDEKALANLVCWASAGPKYTLVQSPVLMNLSGPFVVQAWRNLVKKDEAASWSLVLVHDDLERDFGTVRLVGWERSAQGHNGVKSAKAWLSQAKYPQSPFARIAVGIGRPSRRDAQTVSKYVLRKIPGEKKRDLEGAVAYEGERKLVELEEWKGELQA